MFEDESQNEWSIGDECLGLRVRSVEKQNVMASMPPYTYKFVKNQSGLPSNSSEKKKIGYLSKDVKVINDLIDDLSKLKTAENDASATANSEMTNPLESINQDHDHDKEDTPSISSSSTHKSGLSNREKQPKLKEQVRLASIWSHSGEDWMKNCDFWLAFDFKLRV